MSLINRIEDDGLQIGRILRRQVQVASGAGSFIVYIVEFPSDRLMVDSFARANIICPESIRRSVPKRQAEFFFGRLAARDALSALGCPCEQVHVGPQRQPIWPEGIMGSITHTDHMAAAVAERPGIYRGIGIDVEQIMHRETCSSVSAIVVDQRELNYLRSLQELPLHVALTIVFSGKESFYKAMYNNIQSFFDFTAISVVQLDIQSHRMTFVLNQTLNSEFFSGQICSAGFVFIRNNVVLTHFFL